MSDNQPVPIKDVLADPAHPAHSAATDMLEKLRKGELNMCACMGAGYGEPYCPCEMSRRGLPPSPERVRATEESDRQLKNLVNSGFFAKPA